ncbi:AraC family transcriptional regulator [Pedobacter sp. P351]|uniref:AraC family transcriptional regulator n=1 Tax=Pedobacter superstes TaxID=3133441 RepID=UPI0030A74029
MNISNKTEKKIKEGFVGQKMIVLPPNLKHNVLKNELIKRFYLTAIGFYPHAAFHDRERKSGSNQYILLYCTAGIGTVKIRDKVYKLTPNHFIILPRNIAHQYSSAKEDPWTIYWIHFTGECADLLFARYLELGSEPVFSAYDEARIERFEQIFNLLEESFEMRNLEIVNISLQDFVAKFIYSPEINPPGLGSDKISDSISFMKKNLNRQYSVLQMAQQQSLSVTHYSRMFRSKTGSSPNQYFSELKIQKSCQYLYFTNRSIKEICADLGFDDPYYFSRLFKKLMGVSPAKYKSQHKKS